ncbi:MAG: bifunctional lysylphosphatidylglycerol synthetase/lysine--tRNA ligase LysX [Actinomycetota bacterium]|nr:bifunctional lysylphosphatidylglycerol synthetase/lysine--tRNA ligase LysX [Actinomycetota bacterium]
MNLSVVSRLFKGSFNAYGGPDGGRRERVRSPWREQVAHWLGRLLLISAFFSLLAIVFAGGLVVRVVSDALGLLNLPVEPSLFLVALLFALAGAARRRLRAAHTVVVIVMALNVFYSLVVVIAGKVVEGRAVLGGQMRRFGGRPMYGVSERQYVEFTSSRYVTIPALILGIVVLVAVIASRRSFPAKLAPRSRRAALFVLVAGLLTSFGVTLLLSSAIDGSLVGVRERVRWSVRSTFGVSSPAGTFGLSDHVGSMWVFGLAGLLSGLALLLAILVFWRSGRGREMQSADEELAVRKLLLQFGEEDSLGYFATRRDKSVMFSTDGRAALTYRTEGTTCVASADPVGDRGSWPELIALWLRQCRENGWYAAVLSSSEVGTAHYQAAGLRAFALGDEAILEVDSFSLRGREMRPVRQAVTRISRAGYTTQIRRHSELSTEELREVEILAEKWRGEETERGFSMALNRLGDPADGRCVIVTAHDAHGEIRGLLSFVPWGVRGVSLDLMRRDRNAENGLNEFLVAKLMEHGPEHGIRRVSLNFAVFRSIFDNADQVGAGPITKVSDAALSFASRFYQLETLYRSNDKYHPAWVPRWLCYDPALTVTRAALAMGIAEGFVPTIGPKFLTGQIAAETQAPRTEPDFVRRVCEQEQQLLVPVPVAARLSQQQEVRRAKLEALRSAGMQGYPVQVPRTARVADVISKCPELHPNVVTNQSVSVCGRIRALRDLGGVTFAVLDDEGSRIQIMVTADQSPQHARALWRQCVDLGDMVSVTGRVGTSRNGELSVVLHDWQMAAKCLRPLPPLGSVLSDDVRSRQRSLDLLVNAQSLDLLRRRAAGVRALREAFQEREFTEVETPMLQAVHGGATARPFRTYINAYGMDLYLRIAPELYLKRLAVGGMQRVFEMNRNFRNEGVDATHNPEFTSLEAYEAYGDYNSMRVLTRDVILRVATAVNGAPVARRTAADGTSHDVNLEGDWPVTTVHDAVSQAVGETVTSTTERAQIEAICARHAVGAPAEATVGMLVVELYDALVEKQTQFPTFYTDFPLETSPLTRTHRTDPALSERWDLVAFGAEIGTAYSELVDPVDQRARLTAQSLAAAAGDLEAMQIDEAFLAALELAMPPTGGLGLGVDRIVMMLTGASIRQTLAFPFVKPQG